MPGLDQAAGHRKTHFSEADESDFHDGSSNSSLREAQRRSNPFFLVAAKQDGLLREACHRARIRATRWLAMTRVVRGRCASTLVQLGKHFPRDAETVDGCGHAAIDRDL